MHSADAVMDAYLAHCKVHTGKFLLVLKQKIYYLFSGSLNKI